MKIFICEGNHAAYNIRAFSTFNEKEPLLTAVCTVPDTALLTRGRPLFVPDTALPCTVQLHMVARIARLGKSIPARFAHRYVDGITVGAAFTAATLWEELRRQGLPWTEAKGFDGAAAVGRFVPPADTELRLEVNGETVQRTAPHELLQPVASLVAALSARFKLCQGDLIFTGCPVAGTRVVPDDHIEGFAGDERLLAFNVK